MARATTTTNPLTEHASGRALSVRGVTASGRAARDVRLMGLTAASGAFDAIAFLALGKVFTAFMTGNLVFLGFRASGADGPRVVRVLAALGGFTLGVFLATRIVGRSPGDDAWPRSVTAALAVTAATEAAFLVGWLAVSGEPSRHVGDLLIGVSALAMGTQSGAVAALDVTGVFTTAATGTLLALAKDVAEPAHQAAERRRLVGVLVALVLGAFVGGLLLLHARSYAPALPLALTLLVLAMRRRR
jgi:uncharacterized membrane protein YoaK (UPF0700 family)